MISKFPVLAALLLLLSACGGSDHPVANADTKAHGSDGDGLVLGVAKNPHGALSARDNATLAVNAYLWRATLDILSFMPLASADPFGGVIITDWYQPPAAPGERFKATAYILGRELRTDAIRVSIFRQSAQNGHWVDATVSPDTVGEIEDKILARARELREQAGAPG
jgi:hypothetical protein